MTTITEMRVHMDCPGCENAVRKSLEKIKGVDEVDIDMGMQKVTVTGSAEQKKILKTVRRTGKRAELWQFAYNPEMRTHTNHHQHHHNSDGSVAVAPASLAPQFVAQPASSYNYYKHGYNGDHYQGYTYYNNSSTTSNAGHVFSDENPHGCNVM